ncbi:MAG: hypothetical protein AB7O37_20440 [Vicinamibacteria bacterium]
MKTIRAFSAFVLSLSFCGWAAAQSVSIDHDAVACIMADRFPVIEAGLEPVEAVGRARVLFRAGGTRDWYFVEMKPEQGCFFQGILPKPLAATTRVEYYVEVHDRSLASARTPSYEPAVVAAGGCAPGALGATALSSAKVVAGAVAPGAPALPPGFSSAGVTAAAGTSTGAVAGAAAGATGAAGAATAGSAAAAAGGLSTAAVVGIVGGAAAAGGVAVAASSGDSSETPSSSASPTPAGPSVSGRWVGRLHVDPGGCMIDADLTLDLTQSGNTLSATATVRELTHMDRADCNAQAGQTQVVRGTGSLAGNSVTLTLAAEHGPVTWSGTLSGNSMSGTFPATGPSDPGGTWNVARQ